MPTSLLKRSKAGQEIRTVSRCIAEYLRANSVPVSDIKLLDTIRPLLASAGTGHLHYDWAEAWIRQRKREQVAVTPKALCESAVGRGIGPG